jgi:hypothetical protein
MGMEFMYDTTEYTTKYQKRNGENWETVAKREVDIISGKSDNLFDPQSAATRAEASARLERFIKIIIDSGN